MIDTSTSSPSGKPNDRFAGRRRLYEIPGAVAAIVIIGVALWFLHRELAGLSADAVLSHIRSIPLLALVASAAFAACSYAVLTGYDRLALSYIGHLLPYRHSALTSFMAYAVGHNVGFAALSGGSIRFRMYSRSGLSASEITCVIVFISVTFALGASTLLGLALLFMPGTETTVFGLPSAVVGTTGVVLLAVPVVYFAGVWLRRTPVRIGAWDVAVPSVRIAAAQLAVSIADMTFAAATLYILLAPALDIGFLPFLGVYLLAMAAGLLSNVPGGIGVFEAVLVASLPQVNTVVLLGAVIVYRLIYYVAPLSIALVLLVGHEVRAHGRLLAQSAQMTGGWLAGIAPRAIGTLVFLAGVVLLVSGASPAVESRLALVARGIPLPILEASHLVGSIAGVGLLVLARGLFRRLQTAFVAALILLAVGIAVSLLKALDFEAAILLGVIAVSLILSRREFYRSGSVDTQRYAVQWVAAIVIAVGLSLWVTLISYRHVGFSDVVWWQFAIDAEAPRSLRGIVVAAVTAIAFAAWKTLRIAAIAESPLATTDDMESVRRVLPGAESASANLALLGDKRFLWSADRNAFLMYQVSGDSWIALGDPVGTPAQQEELAWAFRDLVDRHYGRPVFYQVGEQRLSLYVDLGLSLSKLGEEARVALRGLSLAGSDQAELRQAQNRAKKHGAEFDIVPRAGVRTVMPALRRVSDGWLADKCTVEKRFSLGSFSQDYIANFDCALVKVDGKIVAFANLWPAPAGGELSVDLMRYDQSAPKGVMDFLFVELMLWAAENGYQWFNLGMAPLSGLEQRPLAPLWHKLGNLISAHGENFYNFEGLRNYKAKFNPVWQPRYLACPGGWQQLPLALLDTSRLISGGVVGIFARP